MSGRALVVKEKTKMTFLHFPILEVFAHNSLTRHFFQFLIAAFERSRKIEYDFIVIDIIFKKKYKVKYDKKNQ